MRCCVLGQDTSSVLLSIGSTHENIPTCLKIVDLDVNPNKQTKTMQLLFGGDLHYINMFSSEITSNQYALVSKYSDCIRLRSHRFLGSYRVYIKYFLTKTKLSTCFLNQNAFRCDIFSFCSESLLIEKHPRYSISKFWSR